MRLLPAAEGDLAGKESECGFAQALDRLLPTHPRLGRAVIVPSASALEGTALSSLVREAQLGANLLIDLADGFASWTEVAQTRKNSGAPHWDPRSQIRSHTEPATILLIDGLSLCWCGTLLESVTLNRARIQQLPTWEPSSIAVCKEIGLGSVVVMGSALGSLLLAGDEQAYQILAGLLATNKFS